MLMRLCVRRDAETDGGGQAAVRPGLLGVGRPRLEKLKFLLAKETLQLMRAKEMCLKRRKEDIRDRVRGSVWRGGGGEVLGEANFKANFS